MTKVQIIEAIAKDHMVETMVMNIARQPMSADLQDLSQIVYLALLEYNEAALQDLWENDQLCFFVARIVINQYRSVTSPFYKEIREFRSKINEDVDIRHGD